MTPYTCRVIRGSLDLQTASEQWNLVHSLSSRPNPAPLSEDLPLAELVETLQSPEFVSAYCSLVSFLNPPGRCSLVDFFANLVEVYGRRFSRFGLVLLFDQFEELFTRFVDVGAARASQSELPDWRLRWALFKELQALYEREVTADADPTCTAPLPIRIVLSMRSEFIGQLDPVRVFVPALEQCTAHLHLLRVDQAAKAISAPAGEFGYGYSPACYERIIADLTKEERYVEPTHLQVVCEHLWNAKGRELAESASDQVDGLPLVSLEVYDRLQGVRGMMSAFLWGYLNAIEKRDRYETIDILEQLITPSGTRNIVEREYLVNRPLRNPQRRADLLAQLVNRTIVRAETRLGGQFVEITHEFLIAPIKEAVQHVHFEAPEQRYFSLALQTLERVRQIGAADGTTPSLMRSEFDALNKLAQDVVWPGWAVEVMFRNAICYEAAPGVVRDWAARLEARGEEVGGDQPGSEHR